MHLKFVCSCSNRSNLKIRLLSGFERAKTPQTIAKYTQCICISSEYKFYNRSRSIVIKTNKKNYEHFYSESPEILEFNVTWLQGVHSVKKDSWFSLSEILIELFSANVLIAWIAVHSEHHFPIDFVPHLLNFRFLSVVSLQKFVNKHEGFLRKNVWCFMPNKA